MSKEVKSQVEDETEDQIVDSYDDMDGGYENLDGSKFTIPMLLIAGPTSGVITSGDCPNIKMGDWYNSVTHESYGPSVKLIPCYFDEVWMEWKPDMGGLVAKHPVNSLKVSGDVYSGMKNAAGNDIIDTWVYYVLIADKPEAGMMTLNCTSTSIKYAKIWNGLIHDCRLTSGKRAPFFSQIWELTLKKNKKDTNVWYTFGEGSAAAITRIGEVPIKTYLDHVKPVREIAPNLTLQLEAPVSEEHAKFAIEDQSEGKY